jgi:predicted Zn-dependent peptidase
VNKLRITLIGLTALFFIQQIFTAEAQSVKKTRLDNGLVILTKPLTTNSIVSVVVSLRMGSLYETDDQAGLATLMQNTVLKGTKTRTSDQIAEELESMGTRIASTADREYGTVSIQSTAESLYPSLETLYDILQNATFPQEAVDLQKHLQVRSIRARHDQPLYRAVELMVEAQYGSHPFHKPALGYPETVEKLTRDALVKSYAATYIPNNMVITAVGNFDEKTLIAHVTRALGGRIAGEPLRRIPGEAPVHTAPVEKTENRETAASWFALGWFSPRLTDPDYYAMEMLDAITGGSMNSRLFVAIREQRGLAYQVASFVNARMESGLYAAYIGTKPASYEEARKVLLDEIFRMKREKATEEEIQLARNYLRGMYVMGLESNSGQAAQYGQYEILGLGYDFGDRYIPGITRITADDVVRVGAKYLHEGYSMGAVLAKPGQQSE